MAIFHQHFGNKKELADLTTLLGKTFPFQQEHVFKLATTMGIFAQHEKAYHLFKRLLKAGDGGTDPCLYHYAAVAACHIGRFAEAHRLWKQVQKLDPGAEISQVLLRAAADNERSQQCSAYYGAITTILPFEEQFRVLEKSTQGIPDQLKKDPLVRSSFFWALRHGDMETKLQVIQAFGLIADNEVRDALAGFHSGS